MIKVGIVGGTGYTGVELLRLLSSHPRAEILAITSRNETGQAVSSLFPSLRGKLDMLFSVPDDDSTVAAFKACDLVFFATPHGIAMQQAPDLLSSGARVIDLAADFRLKDPQVFEKWYGMPHSQPELLKTAVYGLPEINRTDIRAARLVGLPGCYPTSVQLGLAPVLRQPAPLVDEMTLIADCKSGTSGAGRRASIGMLLSETSDNFHAYGASAHRHYPEIVQGLSAIAGRDIGLTFVPHLVPMIRGIHATLYARILPAAQNRDFQALYEDYYRAEPFVDVLPSGSHPETRSVRGSNLLRIALHRPQADMLLALVVEDNLVKGAAGQAVQCMNLMFGLNESTGLEQVPLLP
ncbi:MAG: N-acetyl-gamma-glutamyl-phosphate reductase [Burkholderiaceae bacterium]|jgi:N-acetyl-gamma-glutamyl-phosphate reductase|nr:N-acetyl-gamma-glutamyl-phosphate reductase [Burkholderiaceae bacterium]